MADSTRSPGRKTGLDRADRGSHNAAGLPDDNGTTLGELAGRDVDAIAVIDDRRSVSWGELDTNTHAIGRGIEAAGLEPGDHVALVSTNRTEFVGALLGCLRAGMVVTPVKTSWTPTEIGWVIEDAGTKLVIGDVDSARQAAESAGIPMVDLDDRFDSWVADHAGEPLPSGRCGWRMSFTSGTTGRPKGVRREADATVSFDDAWRGWAIGAAALGLPRHGEHLMVSQLFHGAPLAFGLGALAAGATMRIMVRWDVEEALERLGSATSSIMVPTMFRQLLALPDERRAELDAAQLVRIVHGGEACPIELKRRMIGWWGSIFTEYYGFTEGGMTMATSDEWLERPGTVGRPVGEQEIVVTDAEGHDLGPGEEGTIHFRRPEGAAAFTYVGAPEKTAAAFRADGSFTVGDLGYVDEDGYLFISGRSAEVIVSAGVNVYPAEIEEVIYSVDGVADCCVAGGPDANRGEQPVAFVLPVSSADPAAVVAAVRARCEADLAGYKRPRDVRIVDVIPRDPTGKVLRSQLRATLWS